jgi:hypothetical protein
VLLSSEVSGHRGSAALVAAVFAATLVVRRTLPLLLLLEAAVVIQLNHTVLPGIAEGGAFMITFLISVFSAGSYLRGRLLVLAGLVVAVLIPLAALDRGSPRRSVTGSSSWSSSAPPSSPGSCSGAGASATRR